MSKLIGKITVKGPKADSTITNTIDLDLGAGNPAGIHHVHQLGATLANLAQNTEFVSLSIEAGKSEGE